MSKELLPITVHGIHVESRRRRITTGDKAWYSESVDVWVEVTGGLKGRRRRRIMVASEPVADIGGMISHGINVENFVNHVERAREKKAKSRRDR